MISTRRILTCVVLMSMSLCVNANPVKEPSLCTQDSLSSIEQKAYEGSVNSAVWLAMSYEVGFCDTRSLELAAVWYAVAARYGEPSAMFRLATIHMSSLEDADRQEKQEILNLLEKSAEQGIVGAMVNLANIFLTGSFGRKDLVQSYIWFARANCGTLPDSGNFQEVLIAKMSKDEIKAAKKILEYDGVTYCKKN